MVVATTASDGGHAEKDAEMIGTTYVDNMDAERHVRPVKDHGKEYECEVFWHANGRSVAGGRTRISKRLFEHPDAAIGFRPWVAEPEQKDDRDTEDER